MLGGVVGSSKFENSPKISYMEFWHRITSDVSTNVALEY